MISQFLTTGAVPFGFTSDFKDSDSECFSVDLCSVSDMWHNFRNPGGYPLPDVILSTTPPPSPLRRAHSYHFLFPEKADDHLRLSRQPLHRAVSVLPTPPPTPTSPQQGSPAAEGQAGSPSACLEDEDPDVDNARTGLGHIQEVRRRFGGNPAHFQPHQSLPQLTWEVPRIHRSRRMTPRHPSPPQQGEGDPERIGRGQLGGGGDGVASTPESAEQRLREIGADLRRIADQFQADNGKVATKKGNDPRMAWAIPAAFTRCISLSLLCVVWWRLLNRLR